MKVKVTTKKEILLRKNLAKVCRMAYKKGLLSGYEGNLSLKLNEDLILITPRNCHKGSIKASDFIIVDKNGKSLSKKTNQPTTEIALHLETYKVKPNIKAIVHAHPVIMTSFSIAGLNFNKPVIPEMITLFGEVPIVPYETSGTKKLARLAGKYLKRSHAVVLENHGAITTGRDIFDAYYKMESLEHAARILFTAKVLGKIKTLNKDDLRLLKKLNLK